MTKQKIEIHQPGAYRFNVYHLTVENLQETFDYFLENNPLFKQEDIYISIGFSHGYYDDIDTEISIHGTRLETDEEYAARLEKEAEKKRRDAENAKKSRAEAKAKRDKKDLEEYERLRKKFEKDKK